MPDPNPDTGDISADPNTPPAGNAGNPDPTRIRPVPTDTAGSPVVLDLADWHQRLRTFLDENGRVDETKKNESQGILYEATLDRDKIRAILAGYDVTIPANLSPPPAGTPALKVREDGSIEVHSDSQILDALVAMKEARIYNFHIVEGNADFRQKVAELAERMGMTSDDPAAGNDPAAARQAAEEAQRATNAAMAGAAEQVAREREVAAAALQTANARSDALAEQLRQAQEALTAANALNTTLTERVTAAEGEAADEKTRADTVRGDLQTAQESIEALTEQAERDRKALQTAETALNDANAHIEALTEQLEEIRADLRTAADHQTSAAAYNASAAALLAKHGTSAQGAHPDPSGPDLSPDQADSNPAANAANIDPLTQHLHGNIARMLAKEARAASVTGQWGPNGWESSAREFGYSSTNPFQQEHTITHNLSANRLPTAPGATSLIGDATPPAPAPA